MTKISVEHKHGEYHIKLEGHATGSSEVCAGLSAISLTLLGYLEYKNVKIIRFEQRDGYLDVVFKGRKARAAYDMAVCGYWLMSQDYPEYCDVYL